MPYITLIGPGIIEDCPECGASATCEHGRDEHGRRVHLWNCLFCGESMSIVCYDCPICEPPPAPALTKC
jgi:hypothetical protein